MDLVTCEAPLDNSFQKDRRELVNKGSLGRRRKPSRSNLKLILSPTSNQQDIVLSNNCNHVDFSNYTQEKLISNSSFQENTLNHQQEVVKVNQNTPLPNNHLKRTKPGNSPLNEASKNYRQVIESINELHKRSDFNANHQLSTSNNHRNSPSPVNHGHVVFTNHQQNHRHGNTHVNSKYQQHVSASKNHQTIASRTCQNRNTYNSHSSYNNISRITSPTQTPVIRKSNHLTNNLESESSRPRNHQNVVTFNNRRQIISSSPIQPKKVTALNEKIRDEISPKERYSKIYIDVIPDENMLYRVPDNTRPKVTQTLSQPKAEVIRRGSVKKSVQEPEWISLSRKLCAKFVEGHIEPHSSDSYPYEEPVGVVEERLPSPEPKIHSGSTPCSKGGEGNEKKISVALHEDNISTSEPPWIPLSRKLCNKFIEEHIEYPPITNGHFVEVPELVEPNGDVRIIEKVGKPKTHKTKQKKEAVPEWVSLSKRLRAKFIESHIDDPDTIALDNQLNASDPEETSSESLSDVSPDVPARKKHNSEINLQESKRLATWKSQKGNEDKKFSEKCYKEEENENSIMFPEKECCWEYQEMEFDQESNSGTFHEHEYYDEPIQEARIHRGSLLQEEPKEFPQRKDFAAFENSESFRNPECYNNDVKFAPSFHNSDPSESSKQNKSITIQIIAHGDQHHSSPHKKEELQYGKPKNMHGSFFNLSTWEDAHNKNHSASASKSPENSLRRNHRSKSLDDVCDSTEDKERILIITGNYEETEKHSFSNRNSLLNLNERTETVLQESQNEREAAIFQNKINQNLETSSNESHINKYADEVIKESSRSKNKRTSPVVFYNDDTKQNNFRKPRETESSSEDEVFLSTSRHKLPSNSSTASQYGKISPQNTSHSDKSGSVNSKDHNNKANKDMNIDSKKENSHSRKETKCNGMIPNSIYGGLPENKEEYSPHNRNGTCKKSDHKEPAKLGMSKWITMSRSEQNVNKNEYSNLKSPVRKEGHKIRQKESSIHVQPSEDQSEKRKNLSKLINGVEVRVHVPCSERNTSSKYSEIRSKNDTTINCDKATNSDKFDRFFKESDLKSKSKSLCDISFNSKFFHEGSNFGYRDRTANVSPDSQLRRRTQIEFQHFDSESDIPLCAKLVSKQDRIRASKSTLSVSTNNGNKSPSPSESSHVYEDMFKETPSGPSDSEASSWTALKSNSYYVNGRSSSMNDLDFSDSCSMSVKCDYASSSENSTLQSRHSSYASSSFYVNLRDYDSHMLEPSLNKDKTGKSNAANNTSPSNISKSNPPTPESLRHLFTSPLSSIHSPPNRPSRLVTRMPSDPQSHYYSTAAATSSAFKHGFAISSPKPKKTERSSSLKIKDIAHGIILTFKKFQNHSKSSHLSPAQYVDVSHLAEMKNGCNSEFGKTKKGQKESSRSLSQDKIYWPENGKTDSDSGFISDVQRAKARRSSSDLTGMHSKIDFNQDKKKNKSGKKINNREKGKKSRSKISEPKTVPTVSRKVQQMADGTLYLVTTVSGDTAMPGVYSDSPDTASEISSHKPVKLSGESNC